MTSLTKAMTNVSNEYNPKLDLAMDYAIIKRDTVNKNTESWETLTNPVFNKFLNLPWDGGYGGYLSWKYNGIQPAIEFVEGLPPIGLAIGSKERLADNILNKYVTNLSGICSPRDVGKLLSKAAGIKYLVENYLKSSEFAKLDSFLRKKGYSQKYEIEEYATGFLPKEATAGIGPTIIYRTKQKGRCFRLSEEIGKIIEKDISFYNVSAINVLLNTIEHEFIHLYGIDNEKQLEELLVEFYEKVMGQLPSSNTTYGYERHSVGKRERQRYEDRRRISKHRASIVEELYDRAKSKGKVDNVTIDELISELEKDGLSKEEIKNAISIYEKKYSRGYNKKTEYSTKEENDSYEDSAKQTTQESSDNDNNDKSNSENNSWDNSEIAGTNEASADECSDVGE